jgi:hypothetical protein
MTDDKPVKPKLRPPAGSRDVTAEEAGKSHMFVGAEAFRKASTGPLEFPPNWKVVSPGPGYVEGFIGAEAFRRRKTPPKK